MEKVFVKLMPHSEYCGFSVFYGVYSSIKKAIAEEIEDIGYAVCLSHILSKTMDDCTYVLILGDWFTDDEIAEITAKFDEDPMETTYYNSSNYCGFCLCEANVK